MNTTRYYFVLFIITFVALVSPPISAKGKQKAVLVTGSSSGIGLNITNHLIEKGYYVYAGARKERDLKRLDAMENVSSVKLDVTKQDEIDAAVKFVRSQGRGLFAVVNNAGVGTFTPMSTFPDDEIIWMHDVNVMGPHRINKAFLPLLKESKGRTTTI
ncbi:MAG: SDR family NAD(P)-dependent oxidoreductase, partial [Kangiellaceae bacterium]|nr:SDR family NAD(P)-dependent oxidoreductase [Kangiellaceae bacterium]